MKYYKLHLIRHGLTQGNLDGRYIGSGTDLPLCAEGRAQLEELKAKFQYPDVPLVFCSPMLRALQTAEVQFIIFQKQNLLTDICCKKDYKMVTK